MGVGSTGAAERSYEASKLLLRCLTHALNHCNRIVKKFANIALRCARSPMGANIASLRYFYDVSFDRKLHVNEQSICKVYVTQ